MSSRHTEYNVGDKFFYIHKDCLIYSKRVVSARIDSYLDIYYRFSNENGEIRETNMIDALEDKRLFTNFNDCKKALLEQVKAMEEEDVEE
jgi:hypothetical protein